MLLQKPTGLERLGLRKGSEGEVLKASLLATWYSVLELHCLVHIEDIHVDILSPPGFSCNRGQL